jgi:uncharacterized protein (TIGR03118 family)
MFASLLCCSLLALMPLGNLSPVVHSQNPDDPPTQPDIPVIPPGSAYIQTNFISDVPGVAALQDPLLVNPWGITSTASSPFWVANNGSSTSTLYQGDAAGKPVVKNSTPPPGTGLASITIPNAPQGLPTGTVSNPTTDFVLPGACAAPPCKANFIFASLNGNITGWNPNAPAAGSKQAIIAASHPGHVYTGLAINSNSGGNRLYAADFANGTIDVYNGSYALTTVTGNFADPTIPTTMGNTYHPFNIQSIGSSLYVMYAKVGADGRDEEGVGNGFVRRFNTDGVRDPTFGINNGPLNSPWGVALASNSFGIFGGALLIGNFGEGNPSIHAFNPTTGAFLGTIQNEAGDGIVIDELWSLTVGNGGNGGDPNRIYFTAGIGEEEHGLFGSLKPTTSSATALVQFSSDSYSIGEDANHLDITVTRSGNVSGTSTANYATFDENEVGHANQKGDYIISAGTVTFAPGETSKTFRVLLEDDVFVEGDEEIGLYLTNPTGAGLGSPNTSTITVTDNDAAPPSTNPLETASFFVRQQYLDFLGREPDAAGLAYWTNQITSCGNDAACITNRRVGVSAAFFIESEFQQTGFFVYRVFKVAFGVRPLYGEYMLGHSLIGFGSNADKTSFASAFLLRPDFQARYPATLTNAQYVDNLLANTTIADTPFRDSLVNGLNANTESRVSVLQKIAEHPTVKTVEFNPAFVSAEYFGYLRRDPDTSGFNFWLNILSESNPPQFRGMVCSFLSSTEYQARFSSVTPRANSECGSITP